MATARYYFKVFYSTLYISSHGLCMLGERQLVHKYHDSSMDIFNILHTLCVQVVKIVVVDLAAESLRKVRSTVRPLSLPGVSTSAIFRMISVEQQREKYAPMQNTLLIYPEF